MCCFFRTVFLFSQYSVLLGRRPLNNTTVFLNALSGSGFSLSNEKVNICDPTRFNNIWYTMSKRPLLEVHTFIVA